MTDCISCHRSFIGNNNKHLCYDCELMESEWSDE